MRLACGYDNFLHVSRTDPDRSPDGRESEILSTPFRRPVRAGGRRSRGVREELGRFLERDRRAGHRNAALLADVLADGDT